MQHGVTELMAENGNLKALLLDILPAVESRFQTLTPGTISLYGELYGSHVGIRLSELVLENQDLVQRIKDATEGFDIPKPENTE